MVCPSHGRFERSEHGYIDFLRDPSLTKVESTSEEYAADQQHGKRRFYDEFLKPWLVRERAQRVLEVGTGLGMEISFLLAEGYDAYGIDLPCLSPFWKRLERDREHFVHCDGAELPFPDGFFDAVFSLGVIEHIGTQVGHYTLRADYQEARQAFARELVRVTRPDGRILMTCPNKSFPIDLAHEPTDVATPPGTKRIRRFVYDRTGMTLHLPWGRYHLLSADEIEALFCGECGASSLEALSMKGYFSFERFGSGPFGMLKGLVAAYVEHLPTILRRLALNPFVVVQIRK